MIAKSAAIVLISMLAAQADGPPAPAPLPEETLARLKPLRDGIATLEDTVAAGIITRAQGDQGIERYLTQASDFAGRTVTLAEIETLAFPAVSEAPKLSALQRFAGLVTFFNILWVLAIGLLVLCAGTIAVLMWPLFAAIPAVFYEVGLYAGSIGLMIYGTSLDATRAPYIGLTGSLLFAAALVFTSKSRKLSPSAFNFSLTCCTAWTFAAFAYGSQMIGFIAVMAFLSALGFSAAMGGLCYVIGFDDDEAVGRGTLAAFVLLGIYGAMRAANASVPGLAAFESGALFMGSFVGYLGLLIMSSRWYTRGYNGKYFLMQLVTFAAGIGALFAGSYFGIGELQKIGGTFFVLWALEKLIELPVEDLLAKAFVGLVASGAIFVFCMYASNHPEKLRPYVFMFN